MQIMSMGYIPNYVHQALFWNGHNPDNQLDDYMEEVNGLVLAVNHLVDRKSGW